jgi:hypothetical protein
LQFAKTLGITAGSCLVPRLKGVIGVFGSRHQGELAGVDDQILVEGGRS